MKEFGFVPRVPVRPEDLANPVLRKQWIEEKGMMVFTFVNPTNPFEAIDLFSEEPIPKDRFDIEQLKKNKN